MPKVAKELSALEVKNLPPGSHAVGGVAGLNLEVTPTGGKTWILRVRTGSKRREIGLGGYPSTTLAEARVKARETRDAIGKGQDPVADRQAAKAALLAQQATLKTFEWCAATYIASLQDQWKNPKHRQQWENTLAQYAGPIIGKMPVQLIALPHVLGVLNQSQADKDNAPLWDSKNETASRLRGRIEKVLDWATVHGYREGLNPARWKGHLDAILKHPGKVQKTKHQPSLPYGQIQEFMQSLRQQKGIAARALEIAILCGNRFQEVQGAKLAEFDLQKGLWYIPAERMKMKKPHVVPLSAQAIKLIASIEPTAGVDLVFPSPRDKEISDMTLTAVIRRMNSPEVKWVDPTSDNRQVTQHGFRSTFRTWGGEQTAHPRDLLETALAHTLESKVEAAYMHGTQIEKRRKLMQDWADYVDLPSTQHE
jgi:integrase